MLHTQESQSYKLSCNITYNPVLTFRMDWQHDDHSEGLFALNSSGDAVVQRVCHCVFNDPGPGQLS